MKAQASGPEARGLGPTLTAFCRYVELGLTYVLSKPGLQARQKTGKGKLGAVQLRTQEERMNTQTKVSWGRATHPFGCSFWGVLEALTTTGLKGTVTCTLV